MNEFDPSSTIDSIINNSNTIHNPGNPKLHCEQMLQAQILLSSSTSSSNINGDNHQRRPIFEMSTSTFNVSCHLVFGPQFQCVLYGFLNLLKYHF